jgi:hypothetical protein
VFCGSASIRGDGIGNSDVSNGGLHSNKCHGASSMPGGFR